MTSQYRRTDPELKRLDKAAAALRGCRHIGRCSTNIDAAFLLLCWWATRDGHLHGHYAVENGAVTLWGKSSDWTERHDNTPASIALAITRAVLRSSGRLDDSAPSLIPDDAKKGTEE